MSDVNIAHFLITMLLLPIVQVAQGFCKHGVGYTGNFSFQIIVSNLSIHTGRFGMSPMGVMLSGVVKKVDKDYKNNGNVKWNFTKFLIDRNGEIVARFEPTDMKNLKAKIEECL